MKILVDYDEWYPVYSIQSSSGAEVSLTEEQIAQIEAAFAAFSAAQDILRSAYEGAAP